MFPHLIIFLYLLFHRYYLNAYASILVNCSSLNRAGNLFVFVPFYFGTHHKRKTGCKNVSPPPSPPTERCVTFRPFFSCTQISFFLCLRIGSSPSIWQSHERSRAKKRGK